MRFRKISLPNVPKSTDRDMTVFLQELRRTLITLSANGNSANLSSGTLDFIRGINKRTNEELGALIEDSLGVGNLLEILNGSITESQLFKDLGDRIDKIEINGTAIEQEVIKTDNIISTIETIQSNVGANTSSVQETKSAIDGINASWSIKADVNGVVGGLGIVNDGSSVDFIIRASKFSVAGPSGSRNTPFTVVTTPTTINGVDVPVGTYMTNAFIMEGSITSAKIGNAQVDTLQLAGQAVIIPHIQHTAGDYLFYTIDTEEVINTLTLDAQGGPVSIAFGFEKLRAPINSRGETPTVYFRVRRDGIEIRKMRLNQEGLSYAIESYTTSPGGDNVETTNYRLIKSGDGVIAYDFASIPTFFDKVPAGDHTYTVTLESRGLNAGKSSLDQALLPVVITARSLHIMGVKR